MRLELTYGQFGLGHKIWMLHEILKEVSFQELSCMRTTMTCHNISRHLI